ncbi:MAG TPA: dTMP kinase [Waddliaceae bacterium]
MFITLEGGEGAGKSTLIANLRNELIARGCDVIVTREPGGSKLGDHIRNCLLNPEFGISFGSQAELLLFLASRAQHIEEVIRPALAKEKVVLCDRFNDSTVAYQGVGRGLGFEYVQQLCDLVSDDIVPDLTFFLDIDPVLGQSRIERQKEKDTTSRPLDRLEAEKLEFHRKVHSAFHQLARNHPKRIHVIDASRSEEDVLKQVLKVIY